MPTTQVSCPRCRQPMTADIQQLFDLNTDPQAKQKLLSGAANMIQCPACGYQGMYPTPIVYHDPEKELLLTYFPAELALPVNEQERMVGPLINKVVDNLQPEKRKSYLFQARNMLTFQTMMETILEADGVTKEMLDAQQKKLQLIQRLLSTPTKESRLEIYKQEEALIDEAFFSLFSRLMEATMQQGDQESAQQLAGFQQELLEETSMGQVIQQQMAESQKAMDDLQNAAKQGLDRPKLLDLFLNAPSEIYISTLIGMVRSGLDYEFFQLMNERIEAAEDQDEKEKIEGLRDSLLEATKKIDEQMQLELKAAQEVLEKILSEPTVEAGLQKYGNQINELFVEAVHLALEEARKVGNLDRSAKLGQINAMIEEANKPPAEIQFIESLLKADNDENLVKMMQDNLDKLDDQFMQTMMGIIQQYEQQGQQPELVKRLKLIYNHAMKMVMKKNLQA
ncbi:MAG: hypothetical protein CL609_02135 [Anaerolineaceae bacterium]|nr:hypothetical protein [Anaerolineaceae bacterium]